MDKIKEPKEPKEFFAEWVEAIREIDWVLLAKIPIMPIVYLCVYAVYKPLWIYRKKHTHMCKTCSNEFATCMAKPQFGNGYGNDNVFSCNKYSKRGKEIKKDVPSAKTIKSQE